MHATSELYDPNVTRREFQTWIGLAAGTLAFSPVAAVAGTRESLLVLTPFPAGNTAQQAMSEFAPGLRDRFGFSATTMAMPGSGGRDAARWVAATRDPRVLLATTPSVVVVTPSLDSNPGYDPRRDFRPVSRLATLAGVLMGRPDLNAGDLTGLIAELRALGRPIRYGSVGIGTFQHLMGELLGQRLTLAVEHRQAASAAEVYDALAKGALDILVDGINAALPAIERGAARGYGVTSRTPLPRAPSLAPLGGSGVAELNGFHVTSWVGVFASQTRSPDSVQALAEGFAALLTDDGVVRNIGRLGLDAASPASASEFAREIEVETDLWAETLRRAGLTQR